MILYILPLLFYSVSGQGIFNVVRFPNTACGSANNFNGTCYTAEECSSLGGSSSGTCASGFGVCCVFSLACGGSTNANTSYATITSFTATSDRDPCTYTYCKCSDDVCKLRKVKGGEKKRIFFNLLELTLRRWLLRDHRRFLMLTLLLGWLLMLLMWSQTATMQGTAPLTHSQVTNPTSLTWIIPCPVAVPGKTSPPVICGYNTGQHMYVPASDSCVTITLDIDTGTSATRNWQIKVTQYECGNLNAPEEDCLQYLTATTGKYYQCNFSICFWKNN